MQHIYAIIFIHCFCFLSDNNEILRRTMKNITYWKYLASCD